jgi:C-terminal processing protease CtpA/Prc
VFVGEPTAGSSSPILARALPTDWALGLPNQRTVDAAGVTYDGTGIPPDEVVVTTPADLDAGRDPALERAVAILSE